MTQNILHKMSWFILILVFCFHLVSAQTVQTLSIDSCYEMAKRNFPLVKQFKLIELSKAYSIENAAKGFFPQVSIGGQATYQSDVTQIPISSPMFSIPEMPKDQYKLYGEINQPITDLYTTKCQKELASASMELEEQKIEVDLYRIKEQINQIYFGILLFDAQIQQTALLKKDIETGIDKTKAAIKNGIALQSNVDVLQAELLKVQQKIIELNAARKSYKEMLARFINQNIDTNVIFEKPVVPMSSSEIHRPELNVFKSQKHIFDVQKNFITVKTLPRMSLFLQTGYGKPALNMFNTELDYFYVTGLRLNWNLSSFYTSKKEKQILELNQNIVDVQKEVFLFNIELSKTQLANEIEKYSDLINVDNEIITLRNSIKNTANEQLANGTITANDYLTYVNASDIAKQNLLLHQIQLLMVLNNYKTTTGN